MITRTYKFADIAVRAVYQDRYLLDMCREYETDEPARMELVIDADDVQFENERSDREGYPYGYLESLALYRKFSEQAVFQNILLFHSSVVAVDGEAYLFTAPSGTGKSTHTALWRQVFKERAVMINDDKPLLRVEEDDVRVYGTPWDGKHHLSTNVCVKVKAICILERGKENKIQKEFFSSAYPFVLSQTYRPDNEMGMKKTLELVNLFMGQIPVYRMECNITQEAAKMAYQAMSGK